MKQLLLKIDKIIRPDKFSTFILLTAAIGCIAVVAKWEVISHVVIVFLWAVASIMTVASICIIAHFFTKKIFLLEFSKNPKIFLLQGLCIALLFIIWFGYIR